MAATAAAAPGAAPTAPAPPAPPPVPEQYKHKNRLQQFVQRNYHLLPRYVTESEGQPHELRFKCIVQIGNEQFSSIDSYNCRKDAEQNAARIAYEILIKREEDGCTEVLRLIDQDVVFSKSILHEFSVKMKIAQPSYSVNNLEGSVTKPLFIATVLFDGNTYTGEVAINKKEAEQKAACAAIKSILATKDTCLLQIIKGKKRHITAITSSGYNKERVSQETHTAPTNTLPPVSVINFTPPITYEAYGGPSLIVPASQDGSSFPIATQANIIPTQLVPVSQAGSVSPVAVQRRNIIPARTGFVPMSQAESGSSIVVEGHGIAPSPTALVPVSKASPASPITLQGPKIILEVGPSVQARAGSKKRKKARGLEGTAQKKH